jgi:hypothetical protein
MLSASQTPALPFTGSLIVLVNKRADWNVPVSYIKYMSLCSALWFQILRLFLKPFLYFNILSITWQLLLSVKWGYLFPWQIKTKPIYGMEMNIKSRNGGINTVIYDRLTSIFFTHWNHGSGLINLQILHYEPTSWPSKQVFDDIIISVWKQKLWIISYF